MDIGKTGEGITRLTPCRVQSSKFKVQRKVWSSEFRVYRTTEKISYSELRTQNSELRHHRAHPFLNPQPSTINHQQRFAFTLIELLVVIAVIGIIAGLTLGVSRSMHRNAMESAMKAQIKKLEVAIEAFRADTGEYPLELSPTVALNPFTVAETDSIINPARPLLPLPPTPGDPWYNTAALVRLLAPDPPAKSYITFGERELRDVADIVPGVDDRVIVDALGNPLGYNPADPNAVPTPIVPISNPATFDLWSVGMDGISGYSVGPPGRPAAETFLPANDDITNWQH